MKREDFDLFAEATEQGYDHTGYEYEPEPEYGEVKYEQEDLPVIPAHIAQALVVYS